MPESLFDQLRARGEGFLTEISNNLMANPTFIELLKKGIAAKEEIDKRVAEGLKAMSVATRKDLTGLERRLEELEARLDAMKAKASSKTRVKAGAESGAKSRPRKGAGRKA
jgi:polyhydroxyalkanoate synthesis regulator phasin